MVSQSHQPGLPSRLVLEGVPPVHYYRPGGRCAEDLTFAASLRACLEYLGEGFGCDHVAVAAVRRPLGCTYSYLLAASGLAFRLLWSGAGWEVVNVALVPGDQRPLEPFRRAFAAAGRRCETLFRANSPAPLREGQTARGDAADLQSQVVASIAERGRPAIAFGVVGPPEAAVVAGYDDGGDVLVGWSFFQDEPEHAAGLERESSGYFRKRAWHADTVGLLTIGERCELPPFVETLRETLAGALAAVRTPRLGPHPSGLAAYTAWADALGRDADFPAGDLPTLRQRYICHFDAVGYVAEGRHYGAQYLKAMATLVPDVGDALRAAAALYEQEHDLMWRVWDLAGGNGVSDAHARRLAEATVRQAIAPVIRQTRELDATAAEHLAGALRAL